MKHWQITLAILAALVASLALAEDFKTTSGKEYKSATVSRVEPDGLVLRTKSGISKVYFTELPKEIQERFKYDPQKGAEFTNQTIEEVRRTQQQKIEADKKRAEQIAKNLEQVRQQQEAEMQRQHETEMQRQRLEAEQQQQVQTQPTYSRSQEGVPEHTYELLQDYTIKIGGWSKRVRRGERYHGRILVDHAEIDIDGSSYPVPSGILWPKD
jgi:vacuolar-type H+-ATPase subunit I/STV1